MVRPPNPLTITIQEENIHWNLNFANSEFAKFKLGLIFNF